MELARKITRPLIAVVLILALLLSLMPVMQADAATKSKPYVKARIVATSVEGSQRQKVSGKYFWCDYGQEFLYCSSSKTGKGTMIGNLGGHNDYDMITNGSKVYFTKTNEKTGKVKLCYSTTSGKTKKSLGTITLKEGQNSVRLLGVYDNKLYYNIVGDYFDDTPLYYKELTGDKKTKRVSKNVNCTYYSTTGGSRYIYGITEYNGSEVKVVDCKNGKVSYTIENVDTSYGNRVRVYDKKLYYVTMNRQNYTYSIYKASLSGKNPEKLFSIPDGYNLEDFDTENAYCSRLLNEETWETEYIEFGMESGIGIVLTQEEFNECLQKL